MISLAKLAPYVDRKVRQMGQAQRFRYFVFFLHGAQYQLGSENLFQTDCSGTICWPLFCMGLNVRMTAQDLFTRLFTRHVPAGDLRDYWDHAYAVFYEHGGRVTHVTPVVGRHAIFDAVNVEQPAQVKALQPVMDWYVAAGYGIYFREIDWEAAERIAEEEAFSWDREADSMLKELLT